MMVRVFVPREHDPADGSDCDGTDHEFPTLPQIGQAIRFTDFRNGDFTVSKVGFIQDGEGFVPAVWTEGEARSVYETRGVLTA